MRSIAFTAACCLLHLTWYPCPPSPLPCPFLLSSLSSSLGLSSPARLSPSARPIRSGYVFSVELRVCATSPALPTELTILTPNRFTHWQAGSTGTVSWVTHVPVPSDAAAAASSAASAASAAKAPLVPICDWHTHGATLSYQRSGEYVFIWCTALCCVVDALC
jgi:hypothetical protein